jgi:hypothetical protein
MKTLKPKTSSYHPQPVWCHHCSIRIAPYALKTVFRGKDYHRDCLAKLLNSTAKSGRN